MSNYIDFFIINNGEELREYLSQFYIGRKNHNAHNVFKLNCIFERLLKLQFEHIGYHFCGGETKELISRLGFNIDFFYLTQTKYDKLIKELSNV